MTGSRRFFRLKIKSLSLLRCPLTLVDVVHVQAPKLFFFKFDGKIMPSLSFPDSTLEQIKFSLRLEIGHADAAFFLKMREALMLSSSSSECEVFIKATFDDGLPLLHIDIDDLRTRLPFAPSRNVQKLLFKTRGDECLWERSPFFDAFFEICHPHHVTAWPDSKFKTNNHVCKLMLRDVLEENKNNTNESSYWPRYLTHVQIRHHPNHKWETLTDSHISFLDGPDPDHPVCFAPKWH